MGSSSSVINEVIIINGKNLNLNGTIYKQIKCGCIYCSHYEHMQPFDIELALPCYDCLESLREKNKVKFDVENVQKMFDVLKIYEMEDLLTERMGWLTEEEAIVGAKQKRISIIEFINSSYILQKYNVKILLDII